MGIRKLVRQTLEGMEDRHYRQRLRERQTVYGEWAAALEAGQQAPMEDPAGDFAVFCAGKGRMARGAWEAIGAYFAANPQVRILYGDEDVWGEGGKGPAAGVPGERRLPWYKPDWSPDVLDSFFYFGSLVAIRGELLWAADFAPEGFGVRPAGEIPEGASGNRAFYEVTDFRVYEKAVQACVELAGGYERAAACVGHVGRILFHAQGPEEQDKFFLPSAVREKRRQLRLLTLGGMLERRRGQGPFLSVVIPSKDHPEELKACVEGCVLAARPVSGEAGPFPFEIVLVDNGSARENRERIQDLAGELEGRAGCRIRYLYRPMEFNFSRMCNLGASQAQGELVLFLNDDVTLCQAGTFAEMAALAVRDFTGAVGLKLYYPDSVRIQHGGIANLPSGPVDRLRFLQDHGSHYYGANRGNRNVLAVTGACLMVRRDRFLESGGFAEALRVAFNDVDFCFRMYEAGYRNVCVNGMYAYHHESLSRGEDEAQDKRERLREEMEMLYAAHPALKGEDPYYSPWLNRESLHTTGIRPAYLTAGNRVQRAVAPVAFGAVGEYREDACLAVSIEECGAGGVRGYGVVLGDDNACYERALLFRRDSEEGGGIYALDLEEMYRPDLEENMPDQRNVALCGFAVEIEKAAVPAGRYRLGMAARNRVTGLGLLNWSGRFWEAAFPGAGRAGETEDDS